MSLPKSLYLPPGVALARSVATIPASTESPGHWLLEPKFDGFRMTIVRDGETTSLWSRQKKDLTSSFPELVKAADDALPDDCVLDGEAVIWADGRLDFDALQRRLASRSKAARLAHQLPASYVAFDLLAVAGRDIRGTCSERCRAALSVVDTHRAPGDGVQICLLLWHLLEHDLDRLLGVALSVYGFAVLREYESLVIVTTNERRNHLRQAVQATGATRRYAEHLDYFDPISRIRGMLHGCVVVDTVLVEKLQDLVAVLRRETQLQAVVAEMS